MRTVPLPEDGCRRTALREVAKSTETTTQLYRMAYDARLTGDVLNVFIRALFGELRRRAHELLNLGGLNVTFTFSTPTLEARNHPPS